MTNRTDQSLEVQARFNAVDFQLLNQRAAGSLERQVESSSTSAERVERNGHIHDGGVAPIRTSRTPVPFETAASSMHVVTKPFDIAESAPAVVLRQTNGTASAVPEISSLAEQERARSTVQEFSTVHHREQR